MKKILPLFGIILISSLTINAQELGARFGDVVGNTVAVDGIFSLGEFSRVHADVSFGDNFGAEALYDFLYRPLGSAEGLNWYAGAGVSMLFANNFWLGASGELGLQYTFSGVPISLSADWRPIFWIIDDTDFRGENFGFNVRYVFGSK